MLTLKSLMLCCFLFASYVKGMATSFNSLTENNSDQKMSTSLRDTSSMYYYSFQHQKTIKYQELLNDADVSYIQTCVGRALILTAPNYGEEAKYRWEGPNGFTSELAELKLSDVQLKDNGLYVVNVSKGDLTVLGKIKLEVKPMPVAKVNKSNFMEKETIQLQAADTMLDAKYEWKNMDKKVISKSKDLWISPKKEGKYNYSLTVNKAGCVAFKNIEITISSEGSQPVYNNVLNVLRKSYN